jgi:uncharacterized protein (DUF983 family)
VFKRLQAILFQRCPVCLQGQLFTGVLAMHSHCPRCGVKLERETGYFLNAMFIAYSLGFLILIPTAVLAVVGVVVIVWPLLFRYSRVIWLHMDQVMDPRQG